MQDAEILLHLKRCCIGVAGFRDLTFSSIKIAWVVYGPVSFFPADFGKLYVTRDGGQHWQLVTP